MPQRARTFQVNCCLKVHAHTLNYYRQFRDKSMNSSESDVAFAFTPT